VEIPIVPCVATQVPETPELLTPAEAAALLRIDRKTLRCWGRAGRLDEVRLNARTFRYPAASIAALITPVPTAETERPTA
jgi:predicted site-specific integrase-resolvase